MVTGHGAGFVMCFRNNVCWEIHPDDDPKKFMTVNSGEYVLAIPDYSHQARQSIQGMGKDNESLSSTDSQKQNAMFKKVVMKLSGDVRWLAGLVFERDIDNGGRSFASTPHYKVAFKTPHFAKAENGRVSHSDLVKAKAITKTLIALRCIPRVPKPVYPSFNCSRSAFES